MYSVHCTVYNVQCTMYSVHCTPCILMRFYFISVCYLEFFTCFFFLVHNMHANIILPSSPTTCQGHPSQLHANIILPNYMPPSSSPTTCQHHPPQLHANIILPNYMPTSSSPTTCQHHPSQLHAKAACFLFPAICSKLL